MVSNSRRRSGSSARSTTRKQVVIGAEDTVRVRTHHKAEVKPKTASLRDVKTKRGRVSGASGRPASRLSAEKRTERESKLARQRWGNRLKVAGIVALLGLLVAAGVWVYQSDIFAIEQVAVEGAERLSVDEVRSIAAIPQDATLLRLSVPAVEARLLASPWIRDAHVERDFPTTLRLKVRERVPIAVVDSGGAESWLVDADGFWLAKRSAEQTGSDLVIRDVESIDATAGARTDSETLRNALTVIAGLSPELRALTRLVSAPSVDKTALLTTSDVEIFIGSADDIEQKDRIAREILEQQRGRVVYINVRSVDRPTWRGIDETQ